MLLAGPSRVRGMASSKAVENVPRSNWLVNREGWLQKQSEGMLGKKWQKRWFVLCGYTVRYRRVGLSQLGWCLCVRVLVRVLAPASAEALQREQLCSHGPDAEARKIFLIDNIVDVAAGPPDKPTQFWLQVSKTQTSHASRAPPLVRYLVRDLRAECADW